MAADRFVHDGRPLRDWVLQLVEDAPGRRREAAKVVGECFRRPMDLLTQPGADVAALDKEFQEAVRNVVQVPGFPASDFVRRLFTLSMALEQARLDEWDAQQKGEDAWHDGQHAKFGENPPKAEFRRYIKRSFIRIARQNRQEMLSAPEAFVTGFELAAVIDSLSHELLPAADLIRQMLTETHQGYIASEAICRMGAGAWEFYPDLINGLKRPHPSRDFSRPLGLLLSHFPERISEVFAQLEAPEAEVRHGAIMALGHCGRDTVRRFPEIELKLRHLVDLGRDNLNCGWHIAAETLAQIGVAPETVSLFLSLTRSPVQGCVGTAIECLGELRMEPERVVPRLIALLDEFEEYDPDWCYSGDHYRIVSALECFGKAAQAAVPHLSKRVWRASSSASGEPADLDSSIVKFFGALGPAASAALPELLAVRAEYVRRGREASAASPAESGAVEPLADDESCPYELRDAIGRIHSPASRVPGQ